MRVCLKEMASRASRRPELGLLLACLLASGLGCAPRAKLQAPLAGAGPVGGAPSDVGAQAGGGRGASQPGPAPSGDLVERPPIAPVGPAPIAPTFPAPPVVGNQGGASSGGEVRATSQLGGRVLLPASVLSNGGGAVLSNNGAGVLSNNGAGVLSNNGAGLISDHGGGYRLLAAAGPLAALSRAFLYLSDRDERLHVSASNGQVFATTTDASGQFSFPDTNDAGFPQGLDTVVNVLAPPNLRLSGFLVPQAGGNSLEVSLGSTAATEFLKAEALAAARWMASYDLASFKALVTATDQAIASGEIPAVADVGGSQVLAFDLRLDQAQNLRNQYLISFSATAVGNAVLKGISDGWKALLGDRPAVITTVMGSGGVPEVRKDYGGDFDRVGFATGDHRDGQTPALNTIPLGFNHGVAVSTRGDVFVTGYTEAPDSGHIRWIHPDGSVTSLWQPTYSLSAPVAVAIEKQPTDDQESNPGVLLVADAGVNRVYRIAVVDHAIYHPDDAFTERHPMAIVAGDTLPLYGQGSSFYGVGSGYEFIFGGGIDAQHPVEVDGEATAYQAPNGAAPRSSRWRASEEGVRRYVSGNEAHASGSVVPNAGRYAHLAQPQDVALDELGNVYICDTRNHRVRFIPSAQGEAAASSYYGYRKPLVDGTGAITGYEATPEPMQAGNIYTVAGGPLWDPARTPSDATNHWFGEFANSDGVRAQLAHLDQPTALAFFEGVLYVADFDNNRIRAIDRSTGTIRTLAGAPPEPQQTDGQGDFDYPDGFTGDGGPARLARLAHPRALTVDPIHRQLYVSDTNSGRIRLIPLSGADPSIQTVAGRLHDGSALDADHKGDGEARRWADLYLSLKLGVDPQGNLLLNDGQHGRLRKLWRQWE